MTSFGDFYRLLGWPKATFLTVELATLLVLLPVQNGRLPDAEGAAGVGPLAAGVPQALAGLASHQHGRDVVDLISGLGAGTLLGLRDPTTFAPAPAGVEDQDQAQDGQQEGNHPALVGGG